MKTFKSENLSNIQMLNKKPASVEREREKREREERESLGDPL